MEAAVAKQGEELNGFGALCAAVALGKPNPGLNLGPLPLRESKLAIAPEHIKPLLENAREAHAGIAQKRGAEDAHEADMELDADLEVEDADSVSEGGYNDDDAVQDEPEETFEHYSELDWDKDEDQYDELEDGLSDDDGEHFGAEDDTQMAPNGGPEDSDDEELYYNDPYADLGFNAL